MPLPPSFLQELRDRLPLSSVAGQRLRLTRAGREYKACCPFHNEKTPSFYINDDKQFYHCFGCGAHGDVIGFAMRHDRLGFPEAVESLAAQAGMPVPQSAPEDRERFDKEKRLYQLLDRATAFFEQQLFGSAGAQALQYLRGRGLSDEAIGRFRLGYAPNDGQALIRTLIGEKYAMDELAAVGLAKKSEDRDEHYSFFRNRVMFPVGDRKGRTVAFGARILGDGEPKYLNSPDHVLFHKGKLLYGLSRARTAIAQNQPLIVVEGYMDVIALVEAGYQGAVAPLGTALTEDQLTALWKLLPPFETREASRDYSPILCFDGDNAGQRAALRAMERALPLLTPAQTLRFAAIAGAKDPDELIRSSGKAAMDALLRQTRPMIDMIWDAAAAGRRLQTPEDRAGFMAALKHPINRIGDETLSKLYKDEVQKRLAAAFGWGANPQAGGQGPRGDWKNRPPAPIVRVSRHPPLSAARQRERAFLALMINHPALFPDFGEDFAQIAFQSPEFEALRQRVIDILSLDTEEPLDAQGLYRHLSSTGDGGERLDSTASGGWQAGLADVLSDTTYTYVSFARPDRPLDAARQGWKSIWAMYVQERIRTDLESARRAYAEENSDESLTRLLALRAQMESLARQADDNDSDLQAAATIQDQG
ncbi:MAG TPA: DNA primase [Alphaproteobacteria bacterium]|nr:DNA primase [Alphaproteobacteria bacterium]